MKHDMSEAQKAAKLAAELKAAAQRARMIDLDWLKLADTSKVTLEEGPYGVTVKGADELMTALKKEKPYLFSKHMRDMNETERAEWWKEHTRRFPGGAPQPEPMSTDKMAKDMSPAEQDAFLKECARRFG
jgi:hypothetical protein